MYRYNCNRITGFLIIFVALLAFLFTSCPGIIEDDTEKKVLTINPTNLELTVGDTSTLTAQLDGNGLTSTDVSWKSNDTAVATVSDEGLVTAISDGNATITATYFDTANITTVTAATTVTVSQVGTNVLTINPTNLELTVGDTSTLTAQLDGNGLAPPTAVSWTSSDTAVATVSDEGLVTAISDGNATITAEYLDTASNTTLTAATTVTVSQAVISVLTISPTALELTVGDTSTLTAQLDGNGLTSTDVSWTSSDTAVATVSDEGLVTAISDGNATITAEYLDTASNTKLTATTTVTVSQAVISVLTINPTNLELTVGDTSTLTAQLDGNGLAPTAVSWTSSDTAVATVSDEGLVTAISDGNATITAEYLDTASNTTLTAATTVTVSQAVISVLTISPTALELTVGDTSTLTAQLDGNGLTSTDVSWTSSDTAVATVSDEGLVTAISDGNATITAEYLDTASNTTLTATTTVTVSQAVISVLTINPTNLELTVGDTSTLTAQLDGNGLAPTAVSWTSSDTAVATVSDEGLVTAISDGNATITAEYLDTASNTTLTAATTVTVSQAVISVLTISPTALELTVGDTSTLTAQLDGNGLTSTDVSWVSSDETVATVSDAGLVTAISDGNATITAEYLDTASNTTLTATTTVTVSQAVISVLTINPTNLELTVGDTSTLTAQLDGNGLAPTAVSWVSSDTAVATVSDAGLVTAISDGNATITAEYLDTASNTTLTAATTVTVSSIVPPSNILPAAGAVDQDFRSVTFQWSAGPATTAEYDLIIQHVGGVFVADAPTGITGTTATYANLLIDNQEYTWEVVAKDATGTEITRSTATNFTTYGMIISPQNDATDVSFHPEIRFHEIPGATRYKVAVYDMTSNYLNALSNLAPVTESPIYARSLSSNTSYYLEVQALDGVRPLYSSKFVKITTHNDYDVSNGVVFGFSRDGDPSTAPQHYEVVKEGKTWNEALAIAIKNGGKLTDINSQIEQDGIWNNIQQITLTNSPIAPDGGGAAYLWIGANDMTTEGTWVWDDAGTDGVHFWTGQGSAGSNDGTVETGAYENWGTNFFGENAEPDNFTMPGVPHQNAAAIALSPWPNGLAGEWNDINEDNALYFIIEYPW